MTQDLQKRFANFSVHQRWPNHINIDVFRQSMCHASDGDLFLRCNELQERYSRLNVAIREAKAQKDALTRRCTDLQESLGHLEDEIRHLESTTHDQQTRVDENNQTATQYSCECALLQNQLPPRLPPPEEIHSRHGDLAKLSDDIFDFYAALLVLRAGEIVLFEDMKKQLEKRPVSTRNLKHTIREIRKKIRDYEHSIMSLSGEQKKWKSTLKAGKINICRRARQQHNGLKEEAAKLKRTIDLFNDEKTKLTKIAQDFENSLGTTLGESELAQLMEHFEPVLEAAHQGGGPAAGDTQFAINPTNLRSMFKPKAAPSSVVRTSGVLMSNVELADKVNHLEKQWLDSVATKVKMDGNILRADFDIELLDASLTAESYYDKKLLECEKKKLVRKYVSEKPSDELMGIRDSELAEYFDPDVKFPGRNRCMELTGSS